MRNKLLLLLLVSLGTSVAVANEYCDGYKEGYKAGYAQTSGTPPTGPMNPVCPPRKPRAGDDRRSDFDIGYERGEKDGMRDGSH